MWNHLQQILFDWAVGLAYGKVTGLFVDQVYIIRYGMGQCSLICMI